MCENGLCEYFDIKQRFTDMFHYVDVKPQINDLLNCYWPSIKNIEIMISKC